MCILVTFVQMYVYMYMHIFFSKVRTHIWVFFDYEYSCKTLTCFNKNRYNIY